MKKTKYITAFIILVLAFVYLLWSSFMGAFRYTISPSEFRAAEVEYAGKVVKLSGVVKHGSISYDSPDYNFEVTDGENEIKVHYKGVVPNTFREGAEVMVTGRYDSESGLFQAKELITKCASKYEGG